VFVISYAMKGNIAVFIGEHGNNCAPDSREENKNANENKNEDINATPE
jgi:hypothetical protein